MLSILKRVLARLLPTKALPPLVKPVNPFPAFHIDKHYNDMNRKEKREYKRWLSKHELWGGAEVIERLEKENKLRYN